MVEQDRIGKTSILVGEEDGASLVCLVECGRVNDGWLAQKGAGHFCVAGGSGRFDPMCPVYELADTFVDRTVLIRQVVVVPVIWIKVFERAVIDRNAQGQPGFLRPQCIIGE